MTEIKNIENTRYIEYILNNKTYKIYYNPVYIGVESPCLYRSCRDSTWAFECEKLTNPIKGDYYIIKIDKTYRHTTFFLVSNNEDNVWDCFTYIIKNDDNEENVLTSMFQTNIHNILSF